MSPREVDAEGDLTLRGQLSCSSADDLQGQSVLIEDHDGGLVETIELTGFDGESNEAGEVVVKAPVRPGTHVWRAVWPRTRRCGACRTRTRRRRSLSPSNRTPPGSSSGTDRQP